MDPESFFHVALKVDDVEESLAFYRDGLGAELVKRLYLFDRAPYEAAGLVDPLPTGVLHFGYVVDDVEAAAEELAASEVKFLMEPTSFGDLEIAFFLDPDGTRIELIERLD